LGTQLARSDCNQSATRDVCALVCSVSGPGQHVTSPARLAGADTGCEACGQASTHLGDVCLLDAQANCEIAEVLVAGLPMTRGANRGCAEQAGSSAEARGPAEVGEAGEARSATSSAKLGVSEASSAKHCVSEASSAKHDVSEARSAKHGVSEASSAKHDVSEARSAKYGVSEASITKLQHGTEPDSECVPTADYLDSASAHFRHHGFPINAPKLEARPTNAFDACGAEDCADEWRVSGGQPRNVPCSLSRASGCCTSDQRGLSGQHRGIVPEGLILGSVSDHLAKLAADEVDSYLDSKARKRGAASEMVDVGLGFHAAESSGSLSEDVSLSEFPAVMRFIAAAHTTLGNDPGLRTERLNVIIRRFSAHQKLGWHRDAIGMFDEDIYGGVLFVGKPGPHGLAFRLQDSRFQANEYAGAVLRSTGESRYQYVHGVEPATDASTRPRYSVTWRWFRLDFLAWHQCSASLKQRWPINFAATCLANGLRWPLVEAFLRRWQQSGEDTLFRGRNDACGPQLSRGEIDQVWWACQTKIPDTELVQNCAPLCSAATQAGPKPRGGLDRRLLPLLEVWVRAMPDPSVPGSKRRRHSSDVPQPAADDAQEELMASMGLPVDFAKRRRKA